VPISFLAPEWGLMLRSAPGTISRAWTMLTNPAYARDHTQDVAGWFLDSYDAVANRRITPATIAQGKDTTGSLWHRPATAQRLDPLKSRLGFVIGGVMRYGFWLGAIGWILAVALSRRRWLDPAKYTLGVLLAWALLERFSLVVL